MGIFSMRSQHTLHHLATAHYHKNLCLCNMKALENLDQSLEI